MPTPPRAIAFSVHAAKPGAAAVADRLAAIAAQAGVLVRTTTDYPVPSGFLAGADAACAIGGDGTLLGLVEAALEHPVPVLGINLGKLGFMASSGATEAEESFRCLLTGDFEVQSRTVLRCEDATGRVARALNDVVIRGHTPRLVHLEVRADGELVNEFSADGLIFSTPTGSTAYNLSAGGPILHPEVHAMALTPICPHTLSNRAVIFPAGTQLEVWPETADGEPLLVALDGQTSLGDGVIFPLRIQIDRAAFPLAHHGPYRHFRLLRTKLGWGEGAEQD